MTAAAGTTAGAAAGAGTGTVIGVAAGVITGGAGAVAANVSGTSSSTNPFTVDPAGMFALVPVVKKPASCTKMTDVTTAAGGGDNGPVQDCLS